MHDCQQIILKKAKPEEYAIVLVVRCTFLNSENGTKGESHYFIKIVMHLWNLYVQQFLLYWHWLTLTETDFLTLTWWHDLTSVRPSWCCGGCPWPRLQRCPFLNTKGERFTRFSGKCVWLKPWSGKKLCFSRSSNQRLISSHEF